MLVLVLLFLIYIYLRTEIPTYVYNFQKVNVDFITGYDETVTSITHIIQTDPSVTNLDFQITNSSFLYISQIVGWQFENVVDGHVDMNYPSGTTTDIYTTLSNSTYSVFVNDVNNLNSSQFTQDSIFHLTLSSVNEITVSALLVTAF